MRLRKLLRLDQAAGRLVLAGGVVAVLVVAAILGFSDSLGDPGGLDLQQRSPGVVGARPGGAGLAGGGSGGGVAVPNDPVVRSLERLREEHGEPPDATYGRMRIPSLGVDAPISYRWVPESGVMVDPSGPDDVSWYDFEEWPGLGGGPGEGKNAIFAGHVDRAAWLDYAGVEYVGPGVFIRLHEVSAGDEIEIEMWDNVFTYRVEWIRDIGTDEDWHQVLSSDLGEEAITLITCGGDFNRSTLTYSHRTVVRAVRI